MARPAMTPNELLAANGISLHKARWSAPRPGSNARRAYTTCPQCSHKRSSKTHQDARCLGVTIEGDSVRWGCNHCNWTGPEKGAPSGNGQTVPSRDSFAATYDYH